MICRFFTINLLCKEKSMSQTEQEQVSLFKEKAAALSSVVVEVKTMDEAIAYALEVCEKKPFCKLMLSGCENELSQKADELCEDATLSEKIISGVTLPADTYEKLRTLGSQKGFKVIDKGLRDYLRGFDISFTIADMGIAETGTVVFDASNEDYRLSMMVCEFHMAVLPKSKIRTNSFEAEEELTAWMKDGPRYTTFVSGPSRTADIERVLAVGVHGPLEMHVMILED